MINIRARRVQRIKELVLEVTKQDKKVCREKLLNNLCYEWAMARRTVNEYINLLISTGFITQYRDEIEGEVLIYNMSRNVDEF